MTATFCFSFSATAVLSLISRSSFSASWVATASSWFFTARSPCKGEGEVGGVGGVGGERDWMDSLTRKEECMQEEAGCKGSAVGSMLWQCTAGPQLAEPTATRPTFMREMSALASFILARPLLMEAARPRL